MSVLNVVKIDLCGSKSFMGRQEPEDPEIRKHALEKLLEVSKGSFPSGNGKYPEGSFYKADGDAVFFLLDRPTVALRGAVEFMRDWFREGLAQYPECKVFIDRGAIHHVPAPGITEVVGKPFENISVFEKSVDPGRIYLTQSVLENCDTTMAKFVRYGRYETRPSEDVTVYYVDFADPRTVEDTSLIHALFVANPKANEARERLFELFAVEYLLQFGQLVDVQNLLAWAQEKNYPMPGRGETLKILDSSGQITTTDKGTGTVYILSEEAKKGIMREREEFRQAREDCVAAVRNSVIESAKSPRAVEGVDLGSLVEDYLCAIFSEIRMMANYFRDTGSLFESQPEALQRFDYLLRRYLPSDLKYFKEWKDGFVRGLKRACEKNNLYIAAVFHNVLSTYYLNRSTGASPYQEERLRGRRIYLDTNVLYSFMVPASCFHEITMYFAKPLRKIGVVLRIFPFTLREYEASLSNVVKQFHGSIPSENLVKKNPWLFQQYMSDQGQYLQRIDVCRLSYSIAKDIDIAKENFDELESRLKAHGMSLERDYTEYTKEEVEDLWTDIRSAMDNPQWELGQYWDFLYSMDKMSEELVRHDVYCLQNVHEKASHEGKDDLGQKVVFLTTDSRKLLRLRKKFPSVLSPEQFLEFILPYLFLGDIPIVDAERFPNQLLSAELGTLLVRRPLDVTQLIAAYLNRPAGKNDDTGPLAPHGSELGALFSDERFRKVAEAAADLDDDGKVSVANELAQLVEKNERANRDQHYRTLELRRELESVEAERDEYRSKIEKLERTVRYWKQQGRRQ